MARPRNQSGATPANSGGPPATAPNVGQLLAATGGAPLPIAIPTTNHLQHVILRLLLHRPCTGRELRGVLERLGWSKTLPAFYQMIEKMEGAGWIEEVSHREDIAKNHHRDNVYEITTEGREKFESSRDFYRALI